MLKKIKIIVADDHPLIRQALRSVLAKEDDFEVVAEAGDGEEVVALTAQLAPDVVIMDISMPKLNGLEATMQIKAKHPNVAILVLTVHNDSEHVLGILEAGAAGYLTKHVFGEEVIHAIHGVAIGETVLSADISKQIIRYAVRHVPKPVPLELGDRLTPREIETLRLVAAGKRNVEIALTMGISLRSIKGYLSEIYSKLRVASRTEAVVIALRAGIISISDLS